MSDTPVDVVKAILADPTDPEVVHRLVASDATYVSLNADNAELKDLSRFTAFFIAVLRTVFARRIPHARFQTIDDAGRLPQIKQP